ncbi:hypothetical protein GCM10010515_08940 [Streptomyces fructofermentans]|uniref:Uncharacterized protein n=1 Tax=Streptomyces fructofermentans TaxID=152141 RepID=A0A918K221_9ACTN|nr:hypothetical protein GCM10010515_08940 [Streptomyces fructofermentans]
MGAVSGRPQIRRRPRPSARSGPRTCHPYGTCPAGNVVEESRNRTGPRAVPSPEGSSGLRIPGARQAHGRDAGGGGGAGSERFGSALNDGSNGGYPDRQPPP